MFPSGVASSTFTDFLADIFGQTIEMTIYVLTETWPYILAAGVLWFFYRVAKSAFHG